MEDAGTEEAAASAVSIETWIHLGEFIALVATVVITIWLAFRGWRKAAESARFLQRKQLAVKIIFELRQDNTYTSGLFRVHNKVHGDVNFDWRALATARYGNGGVQGADADLCQDLLNVLNYLEAVAIAVLNDAVDETIIRLHLRYILVKIVDSTGEFLRETRSRTNNNNAWCNVEALAKKWQDPPRIATPE